MVAVGRLLFRQLLLLQPTARHTTMIAAAISNRSMPVLQMMHTPTTKSSSKQFFGTNRDKYKPEFKNNDVYSTIYKKIQKLNSEKTNFDDQSIYSMSFQGTQGDQFNPFHKDCRVCFICTKKFDTWQKVLIHILTKAKGDHRKKKPLHPNMRKALERVEIQARYIPATTENQTPVAATEDQTPVTTTEDQESQVSP
jgi:hypothetical protein